MAELKLKASSLIEVIVSSVIMLIAFTLSMDILVKLTTSKSDILETLQMEMDIREHIRQENTTSEITTYKWGEIKLIKNDIGNNLIHITYIIKMTKHNREIEFEKITTNKDPTQSLNNS